MRRIIWTMACAMVVAVMALARPAFAEPEAAHTDLEFRVGAGTACGTCTEDEPVQDRVRATVQLFADHLFPIKPIGDGILEIGPYIKGALLDGGDVPQIAGGVALGYRFGNYELLVNGGMAYATERIGETASPNSGQTKHTYDLGLILRYDISRYFISAGYNHNSNGHELGLNFISGSGSNPGYDQLFAGVGVRF